jgi:hypothetical protein
MVRVVLTDEQSKLIATSNAAVSLVDPLGRAIGVAQSTNLTAEELEEFVRRASSNGPWRSSDEVRERLSNLKRPAT